MFWLLAACAEPNPPPPPVVFEPAAVGFGFDGVVLADGALTDFVLDDALFDPLLFEVFASEAFLVGDATDDETCVAYGRFAPPLTDGANVPTDDGSAVFGAWEGTVPIDGTTCLGRVDPAVWGGGASGLWGPLDEARIGFAIGPQVASLEANWDAADLEAVGDSMLAGWFAFEQAAPTTATGTATTFVAHAWTTIVAYEVDPVTFDPLVQVDEDGYPVLVPLDVTGWVPGDPIPAFYARSTPVEYQAVVPPPIPTPTGTTP